MKELQIGFYILSIISYLIAAFNNRVSVKFEWLATALLLIALGIGRV